jgi:spermidine synthase
MGDSINLPSKGAIQCDLFVVSLLFLFLELAFIRWLPAEVLFLTFFTNTILLACFLGLSLGCLAARHKRNYLALTPVLVLVALVVGGAMESVRVALQDILNVGKNDASPQMVFFGTEFHVHDVASFVVPMEAVAGAFFLLVAAAMIGPGQVMGRRFAALKSPVEAYIVNIGGSLVGVLLFSFCSDWLTPVGWFGLAAAGLVYFLWRETPRKWWAIAAAVLAPLLLAVPRHTPQQESWSPYYRIDYSPKDRSILVNLISHQAMWSRNDPVPEYAVPYLLNRDTGGQPFHDILIIGAGSGNDVSRALQFAAPGAHIDAVEIDPVIRHLGERYHPDHPYQDPRVTVHLGDGRNFLASGKRQYDLVVFALVDSLVLHSSVSNIRLESYLFTRESMEAVRRRLKPGGMFVMYNYFRQGWIVSRLSATLRGVFGRDPIVLAMPQLDAIPANLKMDGFTMLLAGDRAEAIGHGFRERGPWFERRGAAPGPWSPNGFEADAELRAPANSIRFSPAKVEVPAGLRAAEDSWPFLYLRSPMIPDLSWRGGLVIAAVSLLLLWRFGLPINPGQFSRLNSAMLFLGAGFMLLETKAVVHGALVFGSTWVVHTMVFSALLAMILGANLWVLKWKVGSLTPFYLVLLAAMVVNIAVPLDSFLGLPRALQGVAVGVLVFSPIFCAGIIFAQLFARAEKPDQALAYNAAGAILGGLLENSSLLIGFQWLLALAAAIYVAAWVAGAGKGRAGA